MEAFQFGKIGRNNPGEAYIRRDRRKDLYRREVASGSAVQSLWLRNGKVRSQVSGMDRSRFPGRRTVRKVRRGGRQGRRASDKVKEIVYRFRVRLR